MSRLLTLTEWMARENVGPAEIKEACELASGSMTGYSMGLAIPKPRTKARIEALTGPLDWSRETRLDVMSGRLRFKDPMNLREWMTVRAVKTSHLAEEAGVSTNSVSSGRSGNWLTPPVVEKIERVTGPLEWPEKPERQPATRLKPLERSGEECAAAVADLPMSELRQFCNVMLEAHLECAQVIFATLRGGLRAMEEQS